MTGDRRQGEGLFFIVGTGRCGSTLLQAMLMSHPQIAIPPETHFFAAFDPDRLDGARPSHDEPPGVLNEAGCARYLEQSVAHPLWRELGISRESLAEALAGGRRSAPDLFLWMLQELFEADSTSPRWLGEKTPRHEQEWRRIASLFPLARFIHIYRDPRDVVASIQEMSWRSSDSVGRTARECRRTFRRQGRAARALGPGRFLAVRYETLVDSPEASLRRVCDFLGADFDPAMLRYHERDEPGYVGSEEGWKERTRDPLETSRIGRFEKRLSPRQIRKIERLMGPHLEALGYARAPRPRGRPAWWWADLQDAWRQRAARSPRARPRP